jgi:transcriptional regulator with XRE-family HTH domain
MRKPINQRTLRKMERHLVIIGRNLYTLRKARKESLKTVCGRLHMAPEILSRMEKGQYNFKLERLWELCKYYGVEVVDIWEGCK